MGGREQAPQLRQVTRAKRRHGVAHPYDLLNDMPRAPVEQRIKPACRGRHPLRCRIREERDAQRGGRLLALAMPLRVQTVDQRMLGVRVENPEAGIGRKGFDREGGSAAVNRHQMILAPETGHTLVEDSARHAHEFILRVAPDLH